MEELEMKFAVYGIDRESRLVFDREFAGHGGGYDAIKYMNEHVEGFADELMGWCEEAPEEAFEIEVGGITYIMVLYKGNTVNWGWYD